MTLLANNNLTTNNYSLSKLFILFVVLCCFTGQTLAATFSCKNVQNLIVTTSTETSCHDEMPMQSSHQSSSTTVDNNSTEDCQDKCSCCITVCASTSLFLEQVSAQKPVDTLIPYFTKAPYLTQTNSVFRPPITV